jgi:hypothetical protein
VTTFSTSAGLGPYCVIRFTEYDEGMADPTYTGPRINDRVNVNNAPGALVELTTGVGNPPRVWLPMDALVLLRPATSS